MLEKEGIMETMSTTTSQTDQEATMRYLQARAGMGPDAQAFQECFGDSDQITTRGEPEAQRYFDRVATVGQYATVTAFLAER